MTSAPGPRRMLHDLRRAASWHRRKLAVLAAIAAVLTGLTALAPPDPPTVPVLRAEGDLAAGSTVGADDVSIDHLPRALVPRAALSAPSSIVGRTLPAPVPEGQVLTTALIISGRASSSPGRVIAPLRLADGAVSELLSHGDVVDVLAAGEGIKQATVLASNVRVVAVPDVGEGSGPASGSGGAVVLVEVDRATANKLAQAAVSSQLSVVWR